MRPNMTSDEWIQALRAELECIKIEMGWQVETLSTYLRDEENLLVDDQYLIPEAYIVLALRYFKEHIWYINSLDQYYPPLRQHGRDRVRLVVDNTTKKKKPT